MGLYPFNAQWSDIPQSKATVHFPFHCRKFLLKRHFPVHRHDFLELTFIVNGEGYQWIENKKYVMKPGTFMFLLPYQIQEMVTESQKQMEVYNCMFDLQLLTSSLGNGRGLEGLINVEEERIPSIQLNETESELIQRLFEKLAEEYEGNGIWRNQLIQSRLWELLILFDRLRLEKHPSAPQNPVYSNLNIWSVIRYVHLHYNEPITLADLAHKFAMSSSYLSEQFKRQLGLNFTQFLHEIRIRHACSLLASTNMSIMDIAMEAGFGSVRTFLRIFKNYKGSTPTDYRKNVNEQLDLM